MKRLYAFRQDPEYTVELYENCVREYKLAKYLVTHNQTSKTKVVSTKYLVPAPAGPQVLIYNPLTPLKPWIQYGSKFNETLTNWLSKFPSVELSNATQSSMSEDAFKIDLSKNGPYSIILSGQNTTISGTTSSSKPLINISGVVVDISGLHFKNVTRPLFDISNNSRVRLSNITISGNKVPIDKTSLINIKNSSSIIQNLTVRDINTSLLNIDVGSKSGIELSGISINNGSNTSTNNRALIRYVSSAPQFSSIRTASAGVTPTPQPSPPTPQPSPTKPPFNPPETGLSLTKITIKDYKPNSYGIIKIQSSGHLQNVTINNLTISGCKNSGTYSKDQDKRASQTAWSPLTIIDTSVTIQSSIFSNNSWKYTGTGRNSAQAITVFNKDRASSLNCHDTSFITADEVKDYYIDCLNKYNTGSATKYWDEAGQDSNAVNGPYNSWPMIRNFNYTLNQQDTSSARLWFHGCDWKYHELLRDTNFMYFLVDQQDYNGKDYNDIWYDTNCKQIPGMNMGVSGSGRSTNTNPKFPSWGRSGVNLQNYWLVPPINTYSNRQLNPDNATNTLSWNNENQKTLWNKLGINRGTDEMPAIAYGYKATSKCNKSECKIPFSFYKNGKFMTDTSLQLRTDPLGIEGYIPYYIHSKYESEIQEYALGVECDKNQNHCTNSDDPPNWQMWGYTNSGFNDVCTSSDSACKAPTPPAPAPQPTCKRPYGAQCHETESELDYTGVYSNCGSNECGYGLSCDGNCICIDDTYTLNNYDGFCYKNNEPVPQPPTPQPCDDQQCCTRRHGDDCGNSPGPWNGCTTAACGLNLRCDFGEKSCKCIENFKPVSSGNISGYCQKK